MFPFVFAAMDILSALTELKRTPIAVISAGVTSILDMPRTRVFGTYPFIPKNHKKPHKFTHYMIKCNFSQWYRTPKEFMLLLIRMMNFLHFSQKLVAVRYEHALYRTLSSYAQ